MQIDGKIAAVYAGALFELVENDDNLAAIEVALKDLLVSLRTDKRVWEYITSPVADPEDKIKLVKKCLQGRVFPVLVNFLCLLADRHRFDALDQVRSEFSALVDNKLGRKHVTVKSAHELSDAEKDSIKKALSGYFKKDMQVHSKVVPDIIGGLVINAGNLVIDTSIKTKLKKINKQLLDHKIFGETFYEN